MNTLKLCLYKPVKFIFVEKEIPTEIRAEAHRLHHEASLDVNAADETERIDDEFAAVGSREPKVCVTTSRDPSSRLKQFSK